MILNVMSLGMFYPDVVVVSHPVIVHISVLVCRHLLALTLIICFFCFYNLWLFLERSSSSTLYYYNDTSAVSLCCPDWRRNRSIWWIFMDDSRIKESCCSIISLTLLKA